METKRDKFVRIVESRTNKILNMLKLLGNCSNTAVYEYSPKDVEKIFGVLESELSRTKRRFSKSGENKIQRFALDND